MAQDNNGKRAMVVTVGFASDRVEKRIADALMMDIEDYHPAFVALASTSQSLPVAEQLAARIQATGVRTEHLPLESAHDLDGIFHRIRDVIARLVDEGYRSEDIAVNFASGSKVMSAAAALAAIFSACGPLRYVRSSVAAQQLPRQQRLISTSARAVFANRDIQQAILLGINLRFQSARQILASIHPDFLTQEERHVSQDLENLLEAYGAWDAFQIARFLELYEAVCFDHKELERFRLPENALLAVRELARILASGSPSPMICVELFNSALRRVQSGAYADAMARLYRALELLAQERLLGRWGIAADDVNAHKIPPRYRPDFEALRSPQDGRIRLGLRKCYELLLRLEDDLGREFHQDAEMLAALDERRDTILAHGVAAVSQDVNAAFFACVGRFFEKHIQDFRLKSRELQFPWLEDLSGSTD
ncbi:MAG: TIGR02710 family CRISPR-associated CARF protein [Candidatus Sumerlaeota bacterium]|nr:TIGR02710 family CRISPR-associated CARF protein [Candidatus Sumerlaeota bacterium]